MKRKVVKHSNIWGIVNYMIQIWYIFLLLLVL